MCLYGMLRKHSAYRRKSLRLRNHDYSSPGWYFVTLIIQDRKHLFGEIKQRNMWLNDYGRIASKTWGRLEERYDHIGLDAWVIMPDHMHGIICIFDNDAPPRLTTDGLESKGGASKGRSRTAPTKEEASPAPTKPIGRIIGAYKTMTTKQINQLRGTEGERIWQRDYYDRIIRTNKELWNVRRYIHNNPYKWWINSGAEGRT